MRSSLDTPSVAIADLEAYGSLRSLRIDRRHPHPQTRRVPTWVARPHHPTLAKLPASPLTPGPCVPT